MPLNGGGGSCFAIILASKHTVVACSDCDWMSNVARSLVMRRPSCVLTKSICNQKHNIDLDSRAFACTKTASQCSCNAYLAIFLTLLDMKPQLQVA